MQKLSKRQRMQFLGRVRASSEKSGSLRKTQSLLPLNAILLKGVPHHVLMTNVSTLSVTHNIDLPFKLSNRGFTYTKKSVLVDWLLSEEILPLFLDQIIFQEGGATLRVVFVADEESKPFGFFKKNLKTII